MPAVIGRTVAALLLFCGGLSAAAAQILPPDQSLVTFNRYVAVRDRVIAGFETSGIPLGSFTLSPSLGVSTEYNDNIFALETAEIDDGYVQITPGAVLQSNFDRASLTLSASGQIDRFFDRSSENREAIDASVYGVQRIGDGTRVRIIGRYRQDRESRESQNAFAFTDRPVRFETVGGAVGVSQQFTSLLLSAEGGVTRARYADARLGGAVFDQDYRNNDQYQARVRAEYAQSPSLAYFAQASQNWLHYEGDTADTRGSQSIEVLGGVRFELPIPARGEIGVGYVRANFDGAAVRTFSGVAVNSTLVLFPTELITVTLNAQRSVNDAGTAASNGYVALIGGVRIDYELRRNIIIGAQAQYERDTFNGFDRRDRRIALGANAEFRVARGWWLRAGYDRLDLGSKGADRYKSFDRNRYQVGLTYRL